MVVFFFVFKFITQLFYSLLVNTYSAVIFLALACNLEARPQQAYFYINSLRTLCHSLCAVFNEYLTQMTKINEINADALPYAYLFDSFFFLHISFIQRYFNSLK